MPASWIEKEPTMRVKLWGYNHYKRNDVLWAGDRGKDGYQGVVAEVEITDDDVEQFPELVKGVSLIMHHRGWLPIDDGQANYGFNDLAFHVECCD